MLRFLATAVMLVASISLAQSSQEDQSAPSPVTSDVPQAPPEEVMQPPPLVPSTVPLAEVPPPALQEDKTMLDGHPREGAFLSGPGSFTFLMHHTLMTGLGVLATQMVPRAIDAVGCPPIGERYASVQTCGDIFGGQDARIAYLTGTLIGAGVGFTGAAVWQFNHWISPRAAHFGIVSSLFGGMTLGGLTDLATKQQDAYATAWLTLLGSSAGAWLAAIVGGGELALNKMALIISGGGWAMIYTALAVAIVATTGGGISARTGLDTVMLTPAVGAGLLALASLKFNPSVTQILRADLFGVAVGGAVLLLSGLLLGPATGFTASPIPYILAGVGAIGAKTVVSLLWADGVEGSAVSVGTRSARAYRGLW